MKYLVALVIIVGLLAILRAQRRRQRMARPAAQRPAGSAADAASKAPARAPARMLQCARCGLHLPGDEAVMIGDLAFCSEEHRRAHRPAPPG